MAATPGRRREAWGHQRRNQLLTHRNRPQQGPPIRAPSGAPPRVQGPCRAASGARAALRDGRVAPARGRRAPVSRRRAVPLGPLRARGRRAVAAARRRLTRIGPTRYGGSTRRVGRSRAFNVWAAAARRRSPRQGPLPPRAEALGSHSPVLQAAIPCHICCHILEILWHRRVLETFLAFLFPLWIFLLLLSFRFPLLPELVWRGTRRHATRICFPDFEFTFQQLNMKVPFSLLLDMLLQQIKKAVGLFVS